MSTFVITASIFVEGEQVRSSGEATSLVDEANEELRAYFGHSSLLPDQRVEIRLPDEGSEYQWEEIPNGQL